MNQSFQNKITYTQNCWNHSEPVLRTSIFQNIFSIFCNNNPLN